jgi:hypothetical protein
MAVFVLSKLQVITAMKSIGYLILYILDFYPATISIYYCLHPEDLLWQQYNDVYGIN